MSIKSLLLAVSIAGIFSLSSCSNLVKPDANHPDVLPMPMYKAKPVPTGASYVSDYYKLKDQKGWNSLSPGSGGSSAGAHKDPSWRR